MSIKIKSIVTRNIPPGDATKSNDSIRILRTGVLKPDQDESLSSGIDFSFLDTLIIDNEKL